MRFLDKVVGAAKDTIKAAEGAINKLMDASLIEATGAALARVTWANGEVKQEEEDAVVETIQNNDKIKDYAPEIVMSFEKHLNALNTTGMLGRVQANQAIQKIKGKKDAAMLLMATCCDIGAADGDFDDDEKKVVKEMCGLVGVNAADFGL